MPSVWDSAIAWRNSCTEIITQRYHFRMVLSRRKSKSPLQRRTGFRCNVCYTTDRIIVHCNDSAVKRRSAIIGFFILFILFLFPSDIFAADVVINEFLPKPSSGSEWVEFYNTTVSLVDLSNYFFDDDTDFNLDGDSLGRDKISLSGMLPGQGTCYWKLGTFLNNDGDTSTLFKAKSPSPLR